MVYQKKRVSEVDDERLKFEISTMYSREVILLAIIDLFWKSKGFDLLQKHVFI